jgi:ABC-type nitrate/sulfonate/bicarbonate transport system substrate-binding protein
MLKPLTKVMHGYYRPYFYWMFPILVAKEQKLFESEGIDLDVHEIASEGQPEDKADWYKKAFENRSRDFYFCCAWQGVYSTAETGKGKIGAALQSTLLKTFAIYTRPDSKITSVLDLVEKGEKIAVNKNADAHYVTLKNLSEFVPSSQIKLAHLGGIERCLTALMNKEVNAATLAGPYAEAAEAIGYRRLLPLSRTEPTVIVLNDVLRGAAASSFLKAINKAIHLINGDRAKYRRRYVREFEEVVESNLPQLIPMIDTIKPRLALPAWAEAKMLGREEFSEIHSFLLEHGLGEPGSGYEGTVDAGIKVAQVSK